ncbi:hypothetical protein BDP55DRAFT_678488 [Colletotrichum godetiae]|uniref:PD-(D/E)XK nuclease-like domain-containing protein n=1 Tax=Colletotrichum godetiae TaxID=1209918 RepID=A0AAJ0EQR3_9PEZI|nr:uncharacterized protein BDP55DRAFT_678488 [Colletotrichum godetiae]KAK1659807.1 hypothetical protein BDP55DRAFT_678488 [Colletotrichum godetiae]
MTTTTNRLQENVQAWLNGLSPCPDSPDSPFTATRTVADKKLVKRRLTDAENLKTSSKRLCRLTPPTSLTMSVSPTKRSHDTPDSSSIASNQDDDQTPRSKKIRMVPGWGNAPLTASSRRSGSVSPKKLARTWAVRDAIARQFTIREDIPASLQRLWKDIGRYDRGIGIIGLAEKASIEDAQTSHPEYEQDVFEDFFYEQEIVSRDGLRSTLGPTPSVSAVLDIMERGISCRNEQMDEAGWNSIVHSRILELAFSGLWSKTDNLVAFAPCTSAKIIPEYADPISRKVDFCACIRPDALSAIAIQSIRDQDALASQSINHTDFPPLQARPIALSIETKIHGEGMNNAEAQLVTWHAAQWRSLDRLVGRTEPKTQLPEFLPGIIIQGREWVFVASTKRSDEVTLWTSQHIGSTAKATGVYQIVCVLQYLKRWIEKTYWPWFKQAILRLPEET